MYQEEEIKKSSFDETNQADVADDSSGEEKLEDEKNGRRKRKKDVVAKEDYEKMQDQYLKALNTAAHHENLSKYYRNEYDKMMKYRSQSLLEAILPTLDGFQLAFKYSAPTPEAEKYRVGFEFVYKLLLGALTSEGMNEIVPKVGEVYNPLTCQVVDTEETNEAAQVGKITEVLLSGYKFKDRIVRPANVKVFVLKAEQPLESKEDSPSDTNTQTEIKN